MKKILVTLTIIIGMPSFAICSIADGESVCTLPNNASSAPLFQTNDISNSPQSQLQTKNNTNSFGRMRNKNGLQMQGTLGCQFGNCSNEPNSSNFLPNQ